MGFLGPKANGVRYPARLLTTIFKGPQGMRYDPSTGIYRDCRWCNGRGCVSCQIEADKEYNRQFPDGPKPIATFSMEDIRAGKLKGILSPEAMESAGVEARKRAEETLKSLGGFRSLLDCSDDEAVEALSHAMFGDVLSEQIIEMADEPESIVKSFNQI